MTNTPVRSTACAVLVSILIGGCRFNLTTPSPIININNTNNNDNTNTNNVSPVSPIVVVPTPPTTTIPGNGSPTNPTTPLALPSNAQSEIVRLGNLYSALVGSCDYLFIDAMLVSLKATDTHWGYVCKRGNCADISQDVVAYHASSGPDVRGATGTYEIDVIGNSCSPAAVPQFLNLGYAATNVFSPTR